MKKIFQMSLLLMFLLAAYASPLLAQLTQTEALNLSKKYETAYNKKDDMALKAMHTENAIRILPDGTVNTGSEAIRLALVNDFRADSLTLTTKLDKVEAAADGSVIITGTYHVLGEKRRGEKFEMKGSYTNTMEKEKGEWKISKTVLVM